MVISAGFFDERSLLKNGEIMKCELFLGMRVS